MDMCMKYTRDIFEVKEDLIYRINDVINEYEYPDSMQVWGTENGWEVLDDEGMVLHISLEIIQEVNYGR